MRVPAIRRQLRIRHFACLLAAGAAMVWAEAAAVSRIVIIGDSTVMTYGANSYPQAGWGQEILHFFNPGTVTITNRAIGGRSSRSFVEDGHWATTKADLHAGDFLMIQFGHNDRSTVTERHADTAAYRKFLTQYVTEGRAKGAIPILVSPMNMNAWNGATLREVFTEGVNDYRAAMMRVAAAQNVPFIDLEKKSAALFQKLGKEYITSFLFMGLQAGEYPNFPNGLADGTHFQEMGAISMAGLVAEGIKELAAHPDVGRLAASLAAVNPVPVQNNKAGSGLVTVGGSFPPGVTLTLKAVPKTGETFLNWADGSGKILTTAKRHTVAMGAAPASFVAQFRGGTTSVGGDGFRARSSDIRIRTVGEGRSRQISVSADSPILAVTALDANGAILQSMRPAPGTLALDLNEVRPGLRFLKVETLEEVRVVPLLNGR